MLTSFTMQRYALVACLVLVGSARILLANGPAPKASAGIIYTPHPPYPYAARHFGLEFSMTVRVTWVAAGPVQEVKVVRSCGDTGLDNYTVRYIRKNWHSEVGKEITHTVTLNYVLRRPGAKS